MREQIIFEEVSNRGESLRQAWSGNMVFELESRVTIDPLETFFFFGKRNHKGESCFFVRTHHGEKARDPGQVPQRCRGRKESRHGRSVFFGDGARGARSSFRVLVFFHPNGKAKPGGSDFFPSTSKRNNVRATCWIVWRPQDVSKDPGTQGPSYKEK